VRFELAAAALAPELPPCKDGHIWGQMQYERARFLDQFSNTCPLPQGVLEEFGEYDGTSIFEVTCAILFGCPNGGGGYELVK
jgi:hypothetical protein